MTARERKVLECAIKWREAKYAVEKAITAIELKHTVDMLIKERRDLTQKRK